ncbi:TspO protein [Candidatus Parcubacteria bacterium]|nr:MAG: TspO protein [Candidatus Parcubacteria bacterium]
MKKYFLPFLFILISQFAGIVGSIFTSSKIPTWYASINKPFFNPPGWLFGPVWIVLYAMMGYASYLIYLRRGENSLVNATLIVFFIHLALNALWSIIFFGLQNPMWAFFEIIILWIMIVLLVFLFYKIDRRAAYLLIPYLLWVSFASVLNFAIWKLN